MHNLQREAGALHIKIQTAVLECELILKE